MPNLPVHIWTFIGFTTFLDDSGRRMAITDLGELQDVLQQFDFYFLWPDCTFLNLLFFASSSRNSPFISNEFDVHSELPLKVFLAFSCPLRGNRDSCHRGCTILLPCWMRDEEVPQLLFTKTPPSVSVGICARRFSPLPTQRP